MAAATATKPEDVHGSGGSRRLRLAVLGLFGAAARLFRPWLYGARRSQPGARRGDGSNEGPAPCQCGCSHGNAPPILQGEARQAERHAQTGRRAEDVVQKCGAKTGSASGEGKDATPGEGGKGKPKGKPKHGTNGGIVPLEFVAAMVGGACTPLEFMAIMAADTGTKLALSLLEALKLPFSNKPNAKYDLHDMYRILLAVCAREGNQSSMDGAYREDHRPGGSKKLISRTRALEIIRGVRHDFMLKRRGNVVARLMARARRYGMLRRSIDAAIDMRDIPLYAKDLMKYAVYSKYRSGTKRFVRLATIHCVVAGQRLALGSGGLPGGRDRRHSGAAAAGVPQARHTRALSGDGPRVLFRGRHAQGGQDGRIHGHARRQASPDQRARPRI